MVLIQLIENAVKYAVLSNSHLILVKPLKYYDLKTTKVVINKYHPYLL